MLNKFLKLFALSGLSLIFFNSFAELPKKNPSIFDQSKNLPVINSPAVFNAAPPAAPFFEVHGYFLQDADSGKFLGMQNPDQKMPPASLTKLMTLYLTFEALQANRIHLTDLVLISEHAWRTGGSRMFIKVNDRVSVNDLLNGVIVDSGNDACVALAEHIGGSENSFADLMNQQAKLLGMNNTHYIDSTGLPNPDHYTTPRDLALLTRAIINDFSQYYPLFAQKTLTFNHITQPNRNRLLWQDSSVDGLKTGHTDAAGYCLIASAKRNNMRLISVLLGAPAEHLRQEYSEALLNYGFRFYETHRLYTEKQFLQSEPVYFGDKKLVSIGLASEVYLTIPAGHLSQLKTVINLPAYLKAPIKKFQKAGTLQIFYKNNSTQSTAEKNIDLIVLDDVKEGNIFKRLWDHLKLWRHQ